MAFEYLCDLIRAYKMVMHAFSGIKNSWLRLLQCLVLMGFATHLHASNDASKVPKLTKLGSYAQNYAIAEPPLDEVLTLRLNEARQSPDAAKATRDWSDAMTKFYTDPPVTPGIVANKNTHSVRFVDPTFAVQADVFGPDGKLAFAKGEKFNPLKYYSVPQPQLFFDARDKRQVFVAKTALDYYRGGIQLIAVAGSPVLTAKALGSRVFYDYGGAFSAKYEIKRVPAMVTQEKSRYRVDELPLPTGN